MTGIGIRARAFLPWLGILVFWALLHVVIATSIVPRVFDGQLIGTDGYMRLVRVTELVSGDGWYDSKIDRMSAPFGAVLHWTRPFDVILVAISAVARPFVSSFDQALLFAGIVVSPLLAACASVLMLWAARPLVGKATAYLAGAILLLQPGFISYTMAGRADHHALQFVILTLAIGLTLRLLIRPPDKRLAVAAGIAYAVGAWVSIELMLLAGLCIAALALHWIRSAASRPQSLLLATGAFALSTGAALLIERAPADLLAVEYDRISIVHVAMAAVTFACWIAIHSAVAAKRMGPLLESVRGRFLACIAAGGLGGLLLILAFPDLIVGPFGQLDPRIVPIWHERVLELRPLVPTSKEALQDFLVFLGGTTPALFLLVHIAVREPAREGRAGWLMLLLIVAVYYALSLGHLRFAPTAELAAAPALAEIARRLIRLCGEKLSGFAEASGKIFGLFALLLGGMFAGAAIPSNANTGTDGVARPKDCSIAAVAPLLSEPVGLGRSPKVIAGLMDYGPELLYRTPHAVIGAPYHRNGDAIWDGYRFLATTDADESRAILARRKADYVLACFSQKEATFYTEFSEPGSLFTRLERGDLPPWLEQMPYDPDTIGGFHIYRIVK